VRESTETFNAEECKRAWYIVVARDAFPLIQGVTRREGTLAVQAAELAAPLGTCSGVYAYEEAREKDQFELLDC
jgi:hypothetical protein